MAKGWIRRKTWLPRRPAPAPEFASRAKNLDDLRDAVDDAAIASFALWLSYLFALFYLLIAVGSVTHRDLLMENPIKLPFLNVELPLVGFFVIGPLLFLIVHAYVLLHFVLLARKVGAFRIELKKQVTDFRTRGSLRRQLPSNFIVQLLAGPRDVRRGVIGFMLRLIAEISLVAAPVALLLFFQLQFLPYHLWWVTWWHRLAILCDLAILWILWPSIASGRVLSITWRSFRRGSVVAVALASLAPLLLAFTIATFPGERLHEALPSVRFVPTAWPLTKFAQEDTSRGQYEVKEKVHSFIVLVRSMEAVVRSMEPSSLHELLVAGDVHPITQKPVSLWSNRLVVPYVDAIDRAKFDTEDKIAAARETFSLRGRRLENAVLIGARLRKVDFTAVQLRGAFLDQADLREARFRCEDEDLECATLQGASLVGAQLQNASLDRVELQRARLFFAELQGVSLDNAQLQHASLFAAKLVGASLSGAQLQDASLSGAQLQDASLVEAQLQGASLDRADLRGASLNGAQLQDASLSGAQLQDASLVEAQLQGASLDHAKLQGALLDRAKLQGASLVAAQFQGASLKEAQLQGVSLDDASMRGVLLDRANLQGASLARAQLQGASFYDAQLQGASLHDVVVDGARFVRAFVWRTDPRSMRGKSVRVQGEKTAPVYRGLDCPRYRECTWSAGSFDALKRSIAEMIPNDERRDEVLKRIAVLDPARSDGEPESVAGWWREIGTLASDEEYGKHRAGMLQTVGCDYQGAPFVIRRFIRSLEAPDDNFVSDRSKLAAAFLDETTCPGARGLTDADKARLAKIRDSAPAPTSFSTSEN